MIQELKYNGITTVPSDYECPDGDMSGMINAVIEDGSVKPICTPETIFTPESGYRVVYIHKVGESENYILYSSNNTIASYNSSKKKTEDIKAIPNIKSVNSIGNTLVVITDDAMHYILWKTDTQKYEYLGTQIPDFPISFGLQGQMRLLSVDSEDKNEKGFEITHDTIEDYASLKKEESQKITDQVLAKINLFIAEQTINKGKFCFPFFIRYALRLYDGTLVNHSAPILMMPSTNICPITYITELEAKKTSMDIMLIATDIDYKVIQSTEATEIKNKWGDIVKDVEIYISKPIYTYDQNGKITSLRKSEPIQSSFVGQLYRGNTPIGKYYEWDFNHILSLYVGGIPEANYTPERDGESVTEDIKNTQTFYLLKTLSLEDVDLSKETRTKIDISESYLQSLTSRQVMTDDYLTHDKIVPSYAFSYNNRLNFANIKRALYGGYNPLSMVSYVECSYRFDSSTNNIIEFSDSKQYTLIVETYIKDNQGDRVVSSTYENPDRTISINKFCSNDYGYKKDLQSWGSYLFYPNTNAYKMVVRDSDGNYFVTPLKPHDFLNGAFAYIGMQQYRDPSTEALPTASTDRIVSDPNKVYTSEINNPFYFPVTGINTIGTGEILGISSAVKALSQGQFGQFPMYVFASDGVWALETSASGTFNAKQPVSRDVCICPESITQVDGAVLFATDRGIMMLQGSTANCISLDLDKDAQDLTAFPHLIELLNKHGYPIPSVDSNFKEYVKDCRMVYDYVNQRIIVAKPNATYAYVYSMKSNTWGMIESTIADSINSYPDAYAVDKNGALIDFSHPKIKDVKATLVTRPIKFDAPNELKTIRTIVQRGMIERRDVKFILYGSRDLVNWYALASTTTSFLKGISGTPYKYFRLAIMADLKEDKSIYGATIDVEPKYNNRIR